MNIATPPAPATRTATFTPPPVEFAAYWIDTVQRTLLFWDTLRRRGNIFNEHEQTGKPPVLSFGYELVVDGRRLARPCNYALLRIVPDRAHPTDPSKRPVVVFDPRAGHGPGIGGFKPDSQVGVAMKSGHPTYFVTFFPHPEPGQTLDDVANAQAHFVRTVIGRHRDAEARPLLVGNCQAGWAVMMLNAVEHDICSALAINGAPLSYWAGDRGQNPMRYAGGLAGGTWPAALMSDLGHGLFDGAELVANFERLNPANTYWKKEYSLYDRVDTEAGRYLDFERWWGGFYLLNSDEIRFITSQLFVGNKLTRGDIRMGDGRVIDLKRITAPIVVFASWGDNITPPQQALNWIADVYGDVDEIRIAGQTIIYALHRHIGHLGIFVSGRVAQKEHAEIVRALDVIDVLPPGLYEMVIERKPADEDRDELDDGEYLVRFEERTIDDILALGQNREDPAPFETLARVSDITEGLYDMYVAPWIQSLTTETSAHLMREMHPLRLQRTLWSDRNPWLAWLGPMAEYARVWRMPCDRDHNSFARLEREWSEEIADALDMWRVFRDGAVETLFNVVYRAPLLQALTGLRARFRDVADGRMRQEEHKALVEKRLSQARERAREGGFPAAVLRMGLHLGRHDKLLDVRELKVLERVHHEYPGFKDLTRQQFADLVRDQFFLLLLDERHALETLPDLLPDPTHRHQALDLLTRMITEVRPLAPEEQASLAELRTLLGAAADQAAGDI